jgi:alpha-tubulin suppressor-like RCC1 family protein
MKVLRTRRLARVAACTALALGMAGMATALPAQARVTAAPSQPQVVASWGFNGDGLLGDGTTADRSRYGDTSFADDVVQVAGGYHHALALRSDGTVWAWGFNGAGELGDGSTTTRTTPVRVTGLTGITQVAAGAEFSLALRSDGTVWAWGQNVYGELGDGTISNHETTPVQVTGLAGVIKIAAGGFHGLALRSDGTVWAWGVNNYGQLGNGRTDDGSAVPVKITALSQVTAIAAGWGSSVAILAGDASVWAWGGNESGQLGDGTLVTRTTPVRVTQIGTVHIAGVTVGRDFAAILSTDGSVWAWGDDTAGQLGNAPMATPVTRPVNTVRAGSGITQFSAGENHVLARKSDGTVLAWGDNTHGELGDGTTVSVTGPVQVTGLTGATQVAAGWVFSLAVHAVTSITVPGLTGDTTVQAGQALQAAGLVLGAVTKVTDKYCDHLGTVISQNPPAGTAVNPGSAVSVTIGQAPPNGCP